MRERGILFSDEMVRAILDGRKTQTRRVVKLPAWLVRNGGDLDRATMNEGGDGNIFAPSGVQYLKVPCAADDTVQRLYCPHADAPGDRLWVREAWRCSSYFDDRPPRDIDAGTSIAYEATPGHWAATGRYRHARFMPRWASRITLEITEVRVQRLHDISEEDAIAEGCDCADYEGDAGITSRDLYMGLWERINGEGSSVEDPWVWAITFKRVEARAA